MMPPPRRCHSHLLMDDREEWEGRGGALQGGWGLQGLVSFSLAFWVVFWVLDNAAKLTAGRDRSRPLKGAAGGRGVVLMPPGCRAWAGGLWGLRRGQLSLAAVRPGRSHPGGALQPLGSSHCFNYCLLRNLCCLLQIAMNFHLVHAGVFCVSPVAPHLQFDTAEGFAGFLLPTQRGEAS